MFADFRTEEPDALARRLETATLPDSVFDLLAQTAVRHPDAPAWRFIDDGVERSWGEVLAKIEGDEIGIVYADFDAEQVAQARAKVPALDNARAFSVSVSPAAP